VRKNPTHPNKGMTAIVGQQKRAATALNNVSPKDEIKAQFESFLLFWYSE
jgi:hypothetical protein